MNDRQRAEQVVGQRLRQVREALNWSQADLAAGMDGLGYAWHQTTVAKTEAARRPLRVDELVALAEVLGVSIDALGLYSVPGAVPDVDRLQVEDCLAAHVEFKTALARLRRSTQELAEQEAALAVSRETVKDLRDRSAGKWLDLVNHLGEPGIETARAFGVEVRGNRLVSVNFLRRGTMASIKRRPNGMWRARYRDAAGKEHSRHFARKVDGQRWLDDETAGLVRGDWIDPRHGKISFDAWFADWSARQVWAEGTLEAALQAGESVTFGAVPMRQLLRSHVEAWVKQMSATLAPRTTRMRFNYVHMALRAAVRDKVIREAPSDGVSLPKVPRAEVSMRIPTPEQVAQARAACPDETFVAFIAVCAYAGLRLGEAAGLQLGDVDFLRREVRIRRQVQGATRSTAKVVPPKAGSARTVYVDDNLLELLSLQANYTWGHEGWLFGVGALLNRNSAGNVWRSTRSKVGMDAFTLHDLRHFYASGLIADGCDVVTVQHALGHSSPTITLNTYSHLWPKAEDRTRAAAASLWRAADSVRTVGTGRAADLLVQR